MEHMWPYRQEAPFWCDLTVPIGIRHSTGASEHGDFP